MKDFVNNSILHMRQHGVATYLYNEEYVLIKGGNCAGWFDFKLGELTVATAREDWLETFAHEYCHFLQSLDGMFDDFNDDLLWDWLDDESVSLTQERINDVTSLSRELEADCERRTIALIKSESLDIDVDRYAQKANAYIYLYNAIAKFHAWPDEEAPYLVDAIVDKFPQTILDRFEGMPDWYEKMVESHCFSQSE